MKTDKRFTLTREFCGYTKARHVLRFCGDFLSSHPSIKSARTTRTKAIAARKALLTSA